MFFFNNIKNIDNAQRAGLYINIVGKMSRPLKRICKFAIFFSKSEATKTVKSMKAVFYIERETEEYIHIIDTGIEEMKVRESARSIVEYLRDNHNLGRRRIIYRNRSGTDNEIKHMGGNFICCGLGHKGIVLPKDSDTLLECMEKLKRLRNKDKIAKP